MVEQLRRKTKEIAGTLAHETIQKQTAGRRQRAAEQEAKCTRKEAQQQEQLLQEEVRAKQAAEEEKDRAQRITHDMKRKAACAATYLERAQAEMLQLKTEKADA